MQINPCVYALDCRLRLGVRNARAGAYTFPAIYDFQLCILQGVSIMQKIKLIIQSIVLYEATLVIFENKAILDVILHIMLRSRRHIGWHAPKVAK